MLCGNDTEYLKAMAEAEKHGYYLTPPSFFAGETSYPLLVCPRCRFRVIHFKENIRDHIARHYPMLFKRGNKSTNKLNGDNFKNVVSSRLPISLQDTLHICMYNLEPKEEKKKDKPPVPFDPLCKKRYRK